MWRLDKKFYACTNVINQYIIFYLLGRAEYYCLEYFEAAFTPQYKCSSVTIPEKFNEARQCCLCV
jgi:hypothetical protein